MGDKIKRKKTRRLGEEMPEKDLCGHRGNDETQTYEIRSNKEIPPPAKSYSENRIYGSGDSTQDTEVTRVASRNDVRISNKIRAERESTRKETLVDISRKSQKRVKKRL